MSNTRKIKTIMKSTPTIEGAGVRLKRVFGYHQVPRLDPFLLLDDFHSENPDDYVRGFPWHPHRGIETITYVLRGNVEHGDSLGHQGVIGSGDVQWMTAGSGIIHQEMPKEEKTGIMWGFQLWANLPAAKKMIDPMYRDVKKEDIPEKVTEDGVKIKIVCGVEDGTRGPVKDVAIDPEYLDITVPPNTSFTRNAKEGHTVFAYVIQGEGYFDKDRDPYAYEVEGSSYFDIERGCLIGAENLVVYHDGDEIVVSTEAQPVRFLLISGKPLREPVAWYGPIVMNTQEELRIAFDEYQRGTFIKHK
jgi:redox-sensitive bicupin YhaK (pirin superfamily)